jgi:hypothetical protein
MDRSLLPILFRDFDVGTSACLIVAALACALLCPPLVLALLFTLILPVVTKTGSYVPGPIAAHDLRPWTRRQSLRGPPAR